MPKTSEIIWVSGPVMRSNGGEVLSMYEMVEVGEQRLIGEVIALDGEVATLQIYEDTGGIRPGDPVEGTGAPLSVEIGPGLLGQIFDGIQRPLKALQAGHRRLHRPGRPGDPPGPGPGLAVHSPAEGRGQGRRRRNPGGGARDQRHGAPGPGASRGCRGNYFHGPGRVLYLEGRHCPGERFPGPGNRALSLAPLAGAPGPALPGAPAALGAPDHWPTGPGCPLSPGQGRRRGHPRRLRHRQDHHPAPALQVVRSRPHRLCGLRRARQRDDGDLDRTARPARSPHRSRPAGAHHSHRQHLQHAGGGPGGLHLYRHHHGRGLSGHGLRRGPDGRLHLPLGRGPAGNLRQTGGDAGGGGLSGVSGHPPGGVL